MLAAAPRFDIVRPQPHELARDTRQPRRLALRDKTALQQAERGAAGVVTRWHILHA